MSFRTGDLVALNAGDWCSVMWFSWDGKTRGKAAVTLYCWSGVQGRKKPHSIPTAPSGNCCEHPCQRGRTTEARKNLYSLKAFPLNLITELMQPTTDNLIIHICGILRYSNNYQQYEDKQEPWYQTSWTLSSGRSGRGRIRFQLWALGLSLRFSSSPDPELSTLQGEIKAMHKLHLTSRKSFQSLNQDSELSKQVTSSNNTHVTSCKRKTLSKSPLL